MGIHAAPKKISLRWFYLPRPEAFLELQSHGTPPHGGALLGGFGMPLLPDDVMRFMFSAHASDQHALKPDYSLGLFLNFEPGDAHLKVVYSINVPTTGSTGQAIGIQVRFHGARDGEPPRLDVEAHPLPGKMRFRLHADDNQNRLKHWSLTIEAIDADGVSQGITHQQVGSGRPPRWLDMATRTSDGLAWPWGLYRCRFEAIDLDGNTAHAAQVLFDWLPGRLGEPTPASKPTELPIDSLDLESQPASHPTQEPHHRNENAAQHEPMTETQSLDSTDSQKSSLTGKPLQIFNPATKADTAAKHP